MKSKLTFDHLVGVLFITLAILIFLALWRSPPSVVTQAVGDAELQPGEYDGATCDGERLYLSWVAEDEISFYCDGGAWGPGWFLPLPGSPAIDAGFELVEVSTDYNRTPRPQGNAYDMGAHEQ